MCGILSSILCFTALVSTSLATAAAISFTAPLAVTALSVPLLGEKVGAHRWSAVLAGFLGALVIIRPGMGNDGMGNDGMGNGGMGDGTEWGAPMLVGSACCTALYQIFTRKLAGQDRAETTNIWSGLVSATVVRVLIPWFWTMPAGPWIWALFLSLGVIGGTGHFLLTKAFERGPAALLSPFNDLRLPGATFTGYFLYRQLPDLATGAGVIVVSGLYSAWRENRRRIRVGHASS